MSANLNFDARTVAPATGFETLPVGWYRAHVTESEVKATKPDQTGVSKGRYLQLTWEVLDEQHKGRKVWTRLNIENPNTQTVEIAQGDLSAICHATGVLSLTNSAQLHHIPVMIRVVIKPGQDGEPRNEVKGYKKVEGVPVTATPSASTASTVPAWAAKRAG